MLAVADSSFVIAVALATEAAHQTCVMTYRQQQNKILLPQSTLAEVGYLITREGGNQATATFLRRLPETKYRVIPLEAEDFLRTAQLLEEYHTARLDFVDATIIAVAERTKASLILTLDRRDFGIVRPSHLPHFDILPAPDSP